MKAEVYHFQINVRDPARSLPLYKALLGYLEYRTVYQTARKRLLTTLCYAVLDPRRMGEDGWFDPAIVQRRWADHLSGRRDSTPALWAVLMFQAWSREQAGALDLAGLPVDRDRLTQVGRALAHLGMELPRFRGR